MPAFEGLRRARPLSAIAPARVRQGQGPAATDDAEAILRRRVVLSFPPGIDASARQRQLEASGLFRQVVRLPERPTPVQWAQANTEPFGATSSDPHRWQWALQAIAAPGDTGAWHLTTGRATVASLESGIVPNHPDVPTTALANFRQLNSTRVFWNEDLAQGPLGLQIRPDQLQFAPGRPPPHHGTHVNTLMAAPLNGSGIAGVCPNCTLQTIRSEQNFSGEPSTVLAGRFGATSLNMSFEPFALDNNTTGWSLALDVLHERDVVLVAAAGNNRRARNNWDFSFGTGSVPHGNANVLKIGATDADNYLWNEARIVGLSTNPPPPTKARRHPVKTLANLCTTPGDSNCIPWVISNRCAGPSDGEQCGSTFGFVPNIIDLVAPGAQVIGGMVTGQPNAPGVYVAVPPDPLLNAIAIAPSQTGLGVGTNGVATIDPSTAGHSWGPMTGTSMATPHVTATAGLMRSINPLLSATAVRQALRDSADPNAVPNYWEPAMGAGLLNARRAVEAAAGSIRGTVQRNRLVPMFALYAATTTVPGEIDSKEQETFGSQELHSWLFTTNPSLVAAATKMDIYQSDTAVFSPTMLAAYEHSHLLPNEQSPGGPIVRRIGIPVPPAMYTLPVGAAKGFRNPAASFWVFTTPHSPLAGFTLQPLYRLSTHHAPACAAEQRKHIYETRADRAVLLIGGTPVCGAHPLSMRYRFESIEGYVFNRAGNRPPGALALFRGYHFGRKVSALVVETENQTTAFTGYTVNTSTSTDNDDFLGWVYPSFVPTGTGTASTTAADTDGDGLIDGLEQAFGLNGQAADGDCEGTNDAVEYGFAQLPSDPMSLTANCADARVSASYNSAQQTVTVSLLNPHGPAELSTNTVVRIVFPVSPSPMSGGGSSLPQGCVIVPSLAIYSVVDCSPAINVAVGSQFDFVLPYAGSNPGSNTATVQPTPGWTDPANSLFASNNSVAF
jgi:subtilisin family serine protease